MFLVSIATEMTDATKSQRHGFTLPSFQLGKLRFSALRKTSLSPIWKLVNSETDGKRVMASRGRLVGHVIPYHASCQKHNNLQFSCLKRTIQPHDCLTVNRELWTHISTEHWASLENWVLWWTGDWIFRWTPKLTNRMTGKLAAGMKQLRGKGKENC